MVEILVTAVFATLGIVLAWADRQTSRPASGEAEQHPVDLAR
jgi:hypothetical protein